MKATSTSISIRLPPESSSTTSVITRPIPVSDTVPTMMPAAAVATPMPIMLRAPASSPATRSMSPTLTAAPSPSWPRSKAISGRCVTITKIMNKVAQKADSAGDICSTIKHQISTTTLSR